MENPQTIVTGSFMKAESVHSYLNHVICRPTLSSIIEKYCSSYKNGFNVLYSVTDLKSVMMPDLFREMESKVITHTF